MVEVVTVRPRSELSGSGPDNISRGSIKGIEIRTGGDQVRPGSLVLYIEF